MTLKKGFSLVDLSQMDQDRIRTNVEQGRDPKFLGEIKLYIGNISFDCTEQDLQDVFGNAGLAVGDISLVRDDNGRPKGFGFVTLLKKEDGLKALEQLNGLDVKGREIAVRESTN
jgi:RNA recognition motif-containing protein